MDYKRGGEGVKMKYYAESYKIDDLHRFKGSVSPKKFLVSFSEYYEKSQKMSFLENR